MGVPEVAVIPVVVVMAVTVSPTIIEKVVSRSIFSSSSVRHRRRLDDAKGVRGYKTAFPINSTGDIVITAVSDRATLRCHTNWATIINRIPRLASPETLVSS